MVVQWAGEDDPGTLRDASTMDRSEEETPSRCLQPLRVDMTLRDTDDDDSEQEMTPETSKISGDVEHQPIPVFKSHQTSTTCQELGRKWLDVPSSAITCSITSSLYLQTPTLKSASSKHSGAGGTSGLPRRILPLTKYSRNLMTTPSVTYATSSLTGDTHTYKPTLQCDVKEWFAITGQQSALVPTSSGDLASEAEASKLRFDFPLDISTSGGGVKSVTTSEAVQSTIALLDVYNLGLTACSGSSGYSSEGFHVTQQKGTGPQQAGCPKLEATRFHNPAQSLLSARPFDVGDISVSQQSVSPSSKPELEAASSHGSPNINSTTHAFHVPHIHDLQSGASSTSEPELVEPLSSLRIDTDVGAAMRSPGGGRCRRRRTRTSAGGLSVGSRTHLGCSTLRYNRKHNPGLHRPRTYKCNTPGQLPLHIHSVYNF